MELQKTGNSRHIGKWLMVVSACLTATGQLFWKWGHSDLLFMALGFVCYGLGAVFMIQSLARLKLSVAYPLMSISYVVALIYGDIFLGEPVTLRKIAAVLLLGIGVTLTSYEK
ncbi:multidrug transporter EmrE-like cation transporter [Paenibacillus forsythiae]|uniref:Multidrug transporter EmrE-like cation transporter n=1 Tax=Paenibacillus forsythiae TaxID=365616 RepID=A0ABU3HAU2_9BACL|nr:EamA family transporter [Paenibacillus forsythiae]MDT3427929.1 multidrug transporter EmrE-like cation transporter [Paenibacillus forsythiae]